MNRLAFGPLKDGGPANLAAQAPEEAHRVPWALTHDCDVCDFHWAAIEPRAGSIIAGTVWRSRAEVRARAYAGALKRVGQGKGASPQKLGQAATSGRRRSPARSGREMARASLLKMGCTIFFAISTVCVMP